MIKFLNKFILILVLFSCSPKKQLSKDECNNASFSCYLGQPNECYRLKEQCLEVEIEYTKEKCQEAFNSLIFGMKKGDLEQKYGSQITRCFNEDQKTKFLRD